MSIKGKNFQSNPTLVKPALILLAVLLLVGTIYTFSKKNDDVKTAQNNEEKPLSIEDQMKVINPTGLDLDEDVDNVGDVEKVIAKWIETNPQAILNAFANMEKKMRAEQEQNAQKNIGSKKDELFNDPSSPTHSPKDYDVTVVEFFDYTCGYCKLAHDVIDKLTKSDKKVRIIYKEFPIMGPASEELSIVSLAVNMTDPAAYGKFHAALMKSKTVRTKEAAINLAKSLGINKSKLEKTIKTQRDKIDEIISNNRTLGQTIGIRGTPGFVIEEELVPGFIDFDAMKAKVSAARN